MIPLSSPGCCGFESTDNTLAKEVLVDIANEEKEHAGEFLRLLHELDPQEEKFYKEKWAKEKAEKEEAKKKQRHAKAQQEYKERQKELEEKSIG